MKVQALSSESIEQFRQYIIGKGSQSNTVKAYSTDLKMLLKYHQTDLIPLKALESLSQLWLNGTRAEVAPRTTGRRLVSIRSFARWAGKPYILAEYRTPTPGRPVPHPIAEGKSGLLAMVEASTGPNEKALVGLLGFTGMRITESLSVTTSSFNLAEKMVTIRGKGDKTRIVPLSSDAIECVGEAWAMAFAKGPSSPVITYKVRNAFERVKVLGERAGLSRPIAPHDLRHTYATLALDNGASLRTVQELLGHASSSTTEGYTAVHVESMRSAVEF